MSISKIFIPNFVCVLTNERYKTYQIGFLFCRLVHAPGVGLWGTEGAKGVIFLFFKHGHVEQNASNIFILGSQTL